MGLGSLGQAEKLNLSMTASQDEMIGPLLPGKLP